MLKAIQLGQQLTKKEMKNVIGAGGPPTACTSDAGCGKGQYCSWGTCQDRKIDPKKVITIAP